MPGGGAAAAAGRAGGKTLPAAGKGLPRPCRPRCRAFFQPRCGKLARSLLNNVHMSQSALALPGPFLDPAAMAIVAGGTLVALLLRTPARDFARGIGALRVLVRPRYSADRQLEQIGALGRIAARHGVITLDRSMIADADVAAAVALIVDGGDQAAVVELLAERRRARTERHLAAIETWTNAADIAPAMGMIGTLVGLVRMFLAMNDPLAIGGAMAVALLSTLYGAALATLVAMPIAHRLRRAAREEAYERLRLEAPLAAFAAREAPRRIAPASAPSISARAEAAA